MKYTLPCIEYHVFKRSSRRRTEQGWVLSRLEVSIPKLEPEDAPVVMKFSDRHRQSWDVRHYDGNFYVPSGYDGLADSVRVTADDLAEGKPEKARGLAMLLRPLMRAYGSSFCHEECVDIFEIWHNIPLENGELQGNLIIDVDKVPTLQISGPPSRFVPRVRETYETAIIVNNEVYRRCGEPRFVLFFENEYDPDRVVAQVDIELEPQVSSGFSGVRNDIYPREAWERPSLRLDRYDDLPDLIELYAPADIPLVLDLPSAPEIIVDPLVVYDDEFDMLHRTASAILSEGHRELLWMGTEVIHRWAHLKDAISAAHDDPNEINIEALSASLAAYGAVITDEERMKIIANCNTRFDMRPVQRNRTIR